MNDEKRSTFADHDCLLVGWRFLNFTLFQSLYIVTWTIQSLYVGTTFAQSFDSRVVSSSQVQQRANLKFNKQLRVTTITRAISLLRIMKLDYRWLCAKLREAKVKVKNDGFLFYLIPANHLCERKGLSFTTKHFLEILFQ